MLVIYKLNRLCLLLAKADTKQYHKYVRWLGKIGVVVSTTSISYGGLTIMNRMSEYTGGS